MNKLSIFEHGVYDKEEKVLLISATKIKKNSYIDSNVDDKMIMVSVNFIQDMIIKGSLGDGLYKTLSTMIIDEAVKGVFRELLEDFIHPVFYYGVVAELIIPLSYKNRNLGNFQINDEKVDATSSKDIKYQRDYYKNKRDYYISRLNDFINENRCFAKFNCPCVKRSGGYNIPINIKI